MTDRVQPIWRRTRALESAGFPASERDALAGTLFGTGPVAARSSEPGCRPQNPANLLVLAPCAGFLFRCYSDPVGSTPRDREAGFRLGLALSSGNLRRVEKERRRSPSRLKLCRNPPCSPS